MVRLPPTSRPISPDRRMPSAAPSGTPHRVVGTWGTFEAGDSQLAAATLRLLGAYGTLFMKFCRPPATEHAIWPFRQHDGMYAFVAESRWRGADNEPVVLRTMPGMDDEVVVLEGAATVVDDLWTRALARRRFLSMGLHLEPAAILIELLVDVGRIEHRRPLRSLL